jgi:TolA-binding protein
MNRLLFVVILMCPALLTAQKKEELQSIQRDVAQLQEQVKKLQKSQDDRFAALQSLIQSAVDASNRVATGLNGLQRDVDTKLSEQQGKLVAPVATLGTKVDQMSDDFRSVATNVADLVRRMNALDTKLADISSAIRTLQTPPPAPAPAQVQVPTGPPAGVSAEALWNGAYKDYQGGKNELAFNEFSEYLKYFGDTARAPDAKYYIGYIYFGNEQWEDAIKAFDDVLGFPENPKTPEALYYKAVSLMKWTGHKSESGVVFKEFIKRYPGSDHIEQAHKNLRVLGMEATPPRKKH